MKSVAELCKPRDSVFQDASRDDTLDLTTLKDGTGNPQLFFAENYMTEGMKTLLDVAFRRFRGQSDTGVIKMTQAMGGGKTHNMLSLAYLAENPDLRTKVLGPGFEDLGVIKVISFTGRETDYPYGIWGNLAEQLGKKDLFSDLYSPLQAPGESAWINLLKGQRLLILLDELPPYLENAKATAIGDSNLCNVTITALSNLFTALGKEQLRDVCLVFSDLRAVYESGSELLQSRFKELEQEANRVAMAIEPVALNSDEIYDILRTRLFSSIPARNSEDVYDIANQYKAELEKANKAGLSNESPARLYSGIRDSYPFHPAIKDLYARFKENPHFQQTRGLIRLMRQIIRQFYESGQAQRESLVHVYDINLNNRTMLSFVNEINGSLANAVNHDIAQGGKAIAEIIDAETSAGQPNAVPYAQNVSRLLFMASLNEVKLGLNGLTDSEILGFLCEPGIDLNQYRRALEEITQRCWYLKLDNRGRHYFQNQKNIVAQINTLVDSFSIEKARKDLVKQLGEMFKPTTKQCYAEVLPMPAVDEIKLARDKITLVIFEPWEKPDLHPDLKAFYDNSLYKNRVMFLSGQKSMKDKLYENCKKQAAAQQVLAEMVSEHVPETDPQYKEAQESADRAASNLLSTITQTFDTLYFPMRKGLDREMIQFHFTANHYDGEQQVMNVLREHGKFDDDVDGDTKSDSLRRKCEQRIFTQHEMTWGQIQERAATETVWQWYPSGQLDSLKTWCIGRDKWRDIGGYITKGPFPKDPTSVTVRQTDYDWDAGLFHLKVAGLHGDTVYYEIGAKPSLASSQAGSSLVTKEPLLHFLCVDSSGEHPTGEELVFHCEPPLKHQVYGTSGGNVLELQSHPGYELRYTTDGSNPRENGGLYDGKPVPVPDDCRVILIAALYDGKFLRDWKFDVNLKKRGPGPVVSTIKLNNPLEYRLKSKKKCNDTEQSYEELDTFAKIPGAMLRDVTVILTDGDDNYMELTGTMPYGPEDMKQAIGMLRETAFHGKEVSVELEYKAALFLTGAAFQQWMDLTKRDMNRVTQDGEIIQRDTGRGD